MRALNSRSISLSPLGTTCSPVIVRPCLRHARSRLQRQRCLGLKAAAAAVMTYPPPGDTSSPYPALPPLPAPPKETTLGSVLPYLAKLALSEKQMKWRLGVAFLCMIVSKAAGLTGPLFLKAAVDALSAPNAAAATAAAGVAASGVGPAVQAIVCFGLAGVLQHVAKELQFPTFSPVSQAAARRVAYHTFAHVLELDIKFHLDRRTGRLSRILERGTRSIQMLYRAILFTFAPTAVEIVFVVALLASKIGPMVAGLVGVTFVTYVAWTMALTQMAVEVRKEVNTLDNLTTSKAVDALLNAETVALFNNQALEVSQYDDYLRSYQRAAIQTERLSAILNAGQSVILAAGLTAVMIAAVVSGPAAAAGTGVMGSGVSPGDLVMIQGVLLQLWSPLQFLGWFYRELRQSLVDMEEFFDILTTRSNLPDGTIPLPDMPPARTPVSSSNRHMADGSGSGNGVHEPDGTESSSSSSSSSSSFGKEGEQQQQQEQALELLQERQGSHASASSSSGSNSSSRLSFHHQQQQQQQLHYQVERCHTDIAAAAASLWDEEDASGGNGVEVELRGVTFGYHADRQVLKGVNLTAAPGKSLAVVGPSGSGKSTILKLVTRLYDVTGGKVVVNGVDVQDSTRESLRRAVAVVPQDTVLFNDTILQNIRYGKPDASDEEVIRAAQLAHLHEAVLRMPEGYKTMVGERGLKLSGGEKQRVAIARAFLRSPRLLICDEATSALDSATEASIMASLAELAQGRTSIFVAHRLSTIKSCDHIVVLASGRVAEEGTHEQLMALGGVYADMWAMQQAAELQRSLSGEAKMGITSSEEEEVPPTIEPLPRLTARSM